MIYSSAHELFSTNFKGKSTENYKGIFFKSSLYMSNNIKSFRSAVLFCIYTEGSDLKEAFVLLYFQDSLLRRLKDEFCQGSGKSSALLEELKVMESYMDKQDNESPSMVCYLVIKEIFSKNKIWIVLDLKNQKNFGDIL